MMQQLFDYIKQARESGMSDDEIRKSLLDSGWLENDINSALGSGDKKGLGLTRNIILAVIIAVLIGIVSYFIFVVKKPPQLTQLTPSPTQTQTAKSPTPITPGVQSYKGAGFSVNYPKNWILHRLNLSCSDREGNDTGGTDCTNLAPIDAIARYKQKYGNDSLSFSGFSAHKTTQTPREWLGTILGGGTFAEDRPTIIINGYPAAFVKSVIPNVYTDYEYAIAHEGTVVYFYFRSYSEGHPYGQPVQIDDYSQYLPDFQSIVNSIKFNTAVLPTPETTKMTNPTANSTSDWATLRNDLYEIKYPGNNKCVVNTLPRTYSTSSNGYILDQSGKYVLTEYIIYCNEPSKGTDISIQPIQFLDNDFKKSFDAPNTVMNFYRNELKILSEQNISFAGKNAYKIVFQITPQNNLKTFPMSEEVVILVPSPVSLVEGTDSLIEFRYPTVSRGVAVDAADIDLDNQILSTFKFLR